MTAAELRQWIKRRRLSHRQAAELLRLSLDGLRKNLYGQTPVSPQTERIAQLLDKILPSSPGDDASLTTG